MLAQTVPPTTVADQVRNIRDILSSPGLEAEAKRQQQQNALVAGSVKVDEFGKSSGFNAALGEMFGSVRAGNHNVVSADGEKIVTLIRSLATADAKGRETGLRSLRTYVDNGAPEALNFVGFAAEYGLLGLRRDLNRARSLYLAAANAHYQPALYNTGVGFTYGRGARVDLAQAAVVLEVANTIATDTSGRVCGLGAFVDDRRNSPAGALTFARGCPSPLASVPRYRGQPGPLAPQAVDELRKSSATGVDDGLILIEQAARRVSNGGTANASPTLDAKSLYCKYLLVNRYRSSQPADPKAQRQYEGLRDNVITCYDKTISPSAVDPKDGRGVAAMRREQAVSAMTGFVPAEIAALDSMRKSNHFHYAWSVPYLPFTQQDVDLFEPLMNHVEGSGQ